MFINTFRYLPEHVDCKLCTEYKTGTGCVTPGCPWLAERIEAGVVGYKEAVAETFADCRALHRRLKVLIRLFPGTLWLDDAHRRRMETMKAQLGYRRNRDTPAFFAAMYLLTSNEDVYGNVANCFCNRGLDPAYARLRGISPHDYTLFAAAKGICSGAEGLTVADLADTEVIDPAAFLLIVNAVLIARYGLAALNLRERKAG